MQKKSIITLRKLHKIFTIKKLDILVSLMFMTIKKNVHIRFIYNYSKSKVIDNITIKNF